jgi:hypothetical protein
MDISIFSKLKNIREMDLAIFIAIVLGIITVILIIGVELPQNTHFSSVYIIPGTYTNYPSGNEVSFQYGIQSLLDTKTKYTIDFYTNSNLVESKEIELNPSDTFEGTKIINLPEDIQYPVKIMIKVKTPRQTNEVHFWVKKDTLS